MLNSHPHPFYVNRASCGEKYWFLSISIPREYLVGLRPSSNPAEVAKALSTLFVKPSNG